MGGGSEQGGGDDGVGALVGFDLIFKHGVQIADEGLPEGVDGVVDEILSRATRLEQPVTIGHKPAMRLSAYADVEAVGGE